MKTKGFLAGFELIESLGYRKDVEEEESETGNDQTAEAEKYINASGETEKKETKDDSEE
ncbi:MAG: hypothetical protein IKO10_10965 [Lachnospiraceae bacterium]|nr:hypothetical protein [Lachnospiraceae bacterium]